MISKIGRSKQYYSLKSFEPPSQLSTYKKNLFVSHSEMQGLWKKPLKLTWKLHHISRLLEEAVPYLRPDIHIFPVSLNHGLFQKDLSKLWYLSKPLLLVQNIRSSRRSHYVNLQRKFSEYKRLFFRKAVLSVKVFLTSAVNATGHT